MIEQIMYGLIQHGDLIKIGSANAIDTKTKKERREVLFQSSLFFSIT
jgi:hypothetical protein